MKGFSIIHAPILSFFSKEFYRDIGLYGKGFGFLYLLLLLVICSVPLTLNIRTSLSHYIDRKVPPLVEKLPRITITNGEVNADVPQPYYIKNPDGNGIFAIIDTTGQINSLVDTGAYALLTKTKLILRESDVEYRIYDLSKMKDFVLDKNQIMSWSNYVKKYLFLVLYPFVVLGTFLLGIIHALLYGVIGNLFASLCRIKLSYDSLLRLAVIAVTPCIIVTTVFVAAFSRVLIENSLMFLMLFMMVAMLYLLFGVWACSHMIEQPPIQDNVLTGDEGRL